MANEFDKNKQQDPEQQKREQGNQNQQQNDPSREKGQTQNNPQDPARKNPNTDVERKDREGSEDVAKRRAS